jgi:hypothetical protein
MKVLVFVLALLAAAKVGLQAYLAASAKTEVIVAAYRERAAGACERAAKAHKPELKAAWSNPTEIRLVVGKPGLDVGFWQLGHVLWHQRFKSTYLFLTAEGPPRQRARCEFNIVQNAAAVFRM